MDDPARRFPAILYGSDYNPEQWTPQNGYADEAVWRDDMRLMREAGVNVATVAVFAWAALQPDEQTYTFDWLDRVMDLLHANGIRACLATATAAQPAWLSAAYPDVLPVTPDRLRRGHGRRQNYCPTSPDFRRLSTALASKLAERYGAHPALELWHVSNEYTGGAGDFGEPCCCDRCAARFRDWLRARYCSLDAVNMHWGTTFWSHAYTDWDQIQPPGPLGEMSLQSLTLDYKRFMSAMQLECYRGEVAVLRAATPDVPITTNMMGTFKNLDYFAWAPYIDIISWDSYPTPHEHPASVAFKHELMRGLRGGQSWMLMEQTPSQVQWQPINPLKRPGVMRLQSYQAVAHGADAVMFFQWRQSRAAFEKYHGAIVAHSGREDARVFREIARLGAELRDLGQELLGARTLARVALMFSWPNWWNVEFRPGPSAALDYVDEVQRYYEVLWKRNVAVAVISPDDDLSPYALVIAPLLNMVTSAQGAAIEDYVENGGVFLTTYFSGVVDADDRAWLGGYPGPLRRALGIWVEEFDPLTPQMRNSIVTADGGPLPAAQYSCDRWCDLVHLEGARALASFGEDFYAGRPAVTENSLGTGRALYVATRPSPDALDALSDYLADVCALTAPLAVPPGVEATRREQQDGTGFTFVLNHTMSPVTVPLSAPAYNLIGKAEAGDMLSLPPRGVAILRTDAAS